MLPGVAKPACSTTINSFPYAESFESGPAGWTTGGTVSDWALGSPTKPTINSAGDGLSCWISGGLTSSQYNPSQRSWLQSPCFDFTTLVNPEIRFLIFWETEYQYDGGNLQYSIDNGVTWQTLGSASSDACEAGNWYDIASITNLSGLASPTAGWSGTIQPSSGSCRGGNGSGGWVTAFYCLRSLAGLPSVTFRFTFGSGTTCNSYDGLAIDLFRIQEVAPVATSMGYVCQSSRTVVFTDNQPDCRTNRQWDFGDGTTETNSAPTISHTFLSEGDYVITLSAEHSCRGTEITVMTIHLLSFNAEIVPPSCTSGGAVTIQPIPSGLSNPGITWADPLYSGFTLIDVEPGLISFQLTADQSCPISDTLVMPGATDVPLPDLGTDRSFCPAEKIPLTPSGTVYS
ncbi:MAG: PKD domain-containing protein [Bacteroidota bacterium]